MLGGGSMFPRCLKSPSGGLPARGESLHRVDGRSRSTRHGAEASGWKAAQGMLVAGAGLGYWQIALASAVRRVEILVRRRIHAPEKVPLPARRAKKSATLVVLRSSSTKGGGFGGVCPALERAPNTLGLCSRQTPWCKLFCCLAAYKFSLIAEKI